MATATKNEITLTLSTDEAETLVMVLMRVGGHPDTTRRGDADSIRQALCSLGIGERNYVFGNDPFELEPIVYGGPSLVFKDRLETL